MPISPINSIRFNNYTNLNKNNKNRISNFTNTNSANYSTIPFSGFFFSKGGIPSIENQGKKYLKNSYFYQEEGVKVKENSEKILQKSDNIQTRAEEIIDRAKELHEDSKTYIKQCEEELKEGYKKLDEIEEEFRETLEERKEQIETEGKSIDFNTDEPNTIIMLDMHSDKQKFKKMRSITLDEKTGKIASFKDYRIDGTYDSYVLDENQKISRIYINCKSSEDIQTIGEIYNIENGLLSSYCENYEENYADDSAQADIFVSFEYGNINWCAIEPVNYPSETSYVKEQYGFKDGIPYIYKKNDFVMHKKGMITTEEMIEFEDEKVKNCVHGLAKNSNENWENIDEIFDYENNKLLRYTSEIFNKPLEKNRLGQEYIFKDGNIIIFSFKTTKHPNGSTKASSRFIIKDGEIEECRKNSSTIGEEERADERYKYCSNKARIVEKNYSKTNDGTTKADERYIFQENKINSYYKDYVDDPNKGQGYQKIYTINSDGKLEYSSHD